MSESPVLVDSFRITFECGCQQDVTTYRHLALAWQWLYVHAVAPLLFRLGVSEETLIRVGVWTFDRLTLVRRRTVEP